jgi:hypothetical protein
LESTDTLAALGELIGQQVDQLWSIAMAIIVAEIYIVCRFFNANGAKLGGWFPLVLLFVSIFLYMASLFCGYLTKGALIEMVKAGADGRKAQDYYDAAAMVAFLQFVFLGIGIVLFVVLFAHSSTKISESIRSFIGE